MSQATDHVLLPFDGSPAAFRALEHVGTIDRARKLRVHVLNVQRPTVDDAVYLPPFVRQAELLLRDACRYLENRRIAHTSEVAVGFPSEVIVASARERRCTAIVMGVRSLMARLLSGSVSRRVLREAGVPVTLVKATGEATPGAFNDPNTARGRSVRGGSR